MEDSAPESPLLAQIMIQAPSSATTVFPIYRLTEYAASDPRVDTPSTPDRPADTPNRVNKQAVATVTWAGVISSLTSNIGRRGEERNDELSAGSLNQPQATPAERAMRWVPQGTPVTQVASAVLVRTRLASGDPGEIVCVDNRAVMIGSQLPSP